MLCDTGQIDFDHGAFPQEQWAMVDSVAAGGRPGWERTGYCWRRFAIKSANMFKYTCIPAFTYSAENYFPWFWICLTWKVPVRFCFNGLHQCAYQVVLLLIGQPINGRPGNANIAFVSISSFLWLTWQDQRRKWRQKLKARRAFRWFFLHVGNFTVCGHCQMNWFPPLKDLINNINNRKIDLSLSSLPIGVFN